jgi:hypothetical protein
MRNNWKNPLCSERREKQIRKAIRADLKRANLTKCKLLRYKRLDTAHITRAFLFATITMPTEVQEA